MAAPHRHGRAPPPWRRPRRILSQVLRYYARRFGAILFSYYATWLLMIALSIGSCALGACVVPGAEFGILPSVKEAVESFFFVQAFEPIWPYFPNGPAWTISTMGLLWLLYPKLQAWLRRPLQARPFALAAGAAIACQLPALLAFFAGCVAPGLGKPYFISTEAGLWMYHFPPLRLADFVLGMALAQALADGRGAPERRAWAWLADGAFVAVFALCQLVPTDPRSGGYPMRQGYEPFFVSGLQPIVGVREHRRGRGRARLFASARRPDFWVLCSCETQKGTGHTFVPFWTHARARLAAHHLVPCVSRPGLFIFASSCSGACGVGGAGGAGDAGDAGGGSRGSIAGAIFRHPVLQGLGEYSFQVYLWHWPIGILVMVRVCRPCEPRRASAACARACAGLAMGRGMRAQLCGWRTRMRASQPPWHAAF
mgnify:CR=1 FL=1